MNFADDTVDINTASVEDFVSRLKGVGHSKAKAIVRFRTTVRKFKKLCELTDVPGISQCILERNQGILLCVSNSTDINTSLQRISDNDISIEEGELSESSIVSHGESEGDSLSQTYGQENLPEDKTWSDRTKTTFHEGNCNKNDCYNQLTLTLDTPSTSSHQLNGYCNPEESGSNNTPVMNSTKYRTRSKSDDRKFPMSTRSHPLYRKATEHTLDTPESDTPEPPENLTPQGPSRGTRGKGSRPNRSVEKERMVTRKMGEATPNSTPLLSRLELPKREPKEDPEMDVDQRNNKSDSNKHQGHSVKILHGTSTKLKQLFSKRKRTLRNTEPAPIQMKRKLDTRLDISKFQSPEKKACKSLSFTPDPNAHTPTFGEFKATTMGVGLYQPPDSKGLSLGTELVPARRFSSDTLGGVCAGKHVKVEGLQEWLGKFKKWNPAERITALDELIDACEPRHVRHMLEVIEPQFQRDFISLLPKELALYVLSFLQPKELLIAAQTCRYWHILTEDNLLWREKCAEESISEPYHPKVCKNSWRSRKLHNGSPVQPSAWKSAYIHRHKIEMNWRNGEYKSIKYLKGHDDHVITCLQFSGTRIVSGSDDNTLKVWSAISGKCLRTLTGHTGGVWASQMRKNMIISGSTDRTLKIWNADSGECTHTLYGHTSTVRCMALHDNIVVSGSRDATLRVWNVESGECLHVLSGHMAAVRCVCYDGKVVVSGAYDYMVKVWDPNTEECLHTLQGHTNRVYSLQFDGVHVVSGSLDTSIRVWSVESGTCLHTLVGHQSLTSGMELKNNILVSGNADSTVKMWDIITGDCLKTLEGPNKHQSAVTCLQFSGKFVVTSSDDGTVKLWDIQSGKVLRDLVSLESRGSGGVVWRIRATDTKLVCAVGSRNGTEETKLLVLDFDPDSKA